MVFILGGGLVFFLYFVEGIILEEKLKIIKVLVLRGVIIYEFNIVRKNLFDIKGGKLVEVVFFVKVYIIFSLINIFINFFVMFFRMVIIWLLIY